MKKVLSFVLVLAMILGSVATAFATVSVATVTKDNTVVPFPDAQDSGVATVLRDLGALKGDENGLVNLKGTLSRAEAATIVVRALGLEDLGKVPTATKFKDVAKDAWYSGYVAQAVATGAMKGQSATTFAPEANITLDECVALVAQTLGYDAAHLAGSWPANYRNVARQVGFLKTVAVGTANATRKDLFDLIYNALDKNKVEWIEKVEGGYVGGNGGDVQYTFAGETLFEAISGLGNKSLGQVYSPAGVSEFITKDTVFANGFDASAFYGKKAFVLYKLSKTAGVAPVKIGIWKLDTTTLKGKFTTVRGTTAAFEKFVAEDGTEYKFAIDGVATATTVAAVMTPGYIYVNGVSTSSLKLSKDVTYELAATLNDEKTKITSIAGVSYWNVNEVAVVNATQAAYFAEGDIVNLNNKAQLGTKKFAVTAAAAGSTKKVYLANSCVVEGAVTSLEDIEENDVVEIYWGNVETNTQEIVKVVVTRNMVEGKISATNSTTYTLGGKAYKRASVSVAGIEAAMGTINSTSEYALYLDSNGKYVYGKLVGSELTPNYSYAFVTGINDINVTNQPGVKKNSATVYAEIWLTVPGESEVVYNTLKFATTAGFVGTASDNGIKVGTLVKVDIQDDALVSIAAVELDGYTSEVKTSKVMDGNKVTADTKIYKIVTTGSLSKDTNYTVLDFDDIVGRTFSTGLSYVADDVKRVVEVIVVSGAAGQLTGETTVITGAAYASEVYNTVTKKNDITFLTKNGTITVAAEKTVTKSAFGTSIWAFSLAGNNLNSTYVDLGSGASGTTMVALVVADREKVEAATCDGDTLVVNERNYYVSDDVQTWFYDEAATVPAYENVDFYEAVGNKYAKKLVVYDFDGDGAYDLIVVWAAK